ncbi:MAG: aminopeptidase P family protein [Pseudomonadota bacterium]
MSRLSPQSVEHFRFPNGSKAPLPFSDDEYRARLKALRQFMATQGIDAILLTSMHNIAYYSGFLYCSFGRPYGCVVTENRCVTISANIDGGQPWRRSISENLVYTDWRRDNFWRAVRQLIAPNRCVGIEGDHVSLSMKHKIDEFLGARQIADIAQEVMVKRLVKSTEEIALLEAAAEIADVGGYAIRDAIASGEREIDIARVGRDAMENAIAEQFPTSELRDTWVWFQSGPNTDGAHNPVTTRRIRRGDLLSLNTFPMVSGYYTALERTLFLGEPDRETRRIWEANVATHELGLSLIKPGISCATICAELNSFLSAEDLLKYRTFGYGHSFGLLSHYYGREAALELREDIDTTLQPGMVVSMEPMLRIPEGRPGAGGYREHDILVVTDRDAKNLTRFAYGPRHNIIDR